MDLPNQVSSNAQGVPEDTTPPFDETPRMPDLRRGLVIWLCIIGVAGTVGLLIGAQELSLMMVMAGLFVAAQAADLDERWTLFYWLLGAVVPVGGCLGFAALVTIARESELSGPARMATIGVSIFAALASLLTVVRPFVDELVSLLFRTERSSHTLRLSARLVLMGLLFAVPGYFMAPDLMQEMLDDKAGFFDRVSFGAEVVGYLALAFASVGYLIRRDLGATLERLGLRRISLAHVWMICAGVLAILVLNSGADWAQQRWLPALWQNDHRINESLARGLGFGRVIMLGITAGVGEEITLRGALQPRLGLVMTAVLFAALHVQYSWFGMIVVGLMGLVLGLIRSRSNTTASIAVHTIYDIVAVFAS